MKISRLIVTVVLTAGLLFSLTTQARSEGAFGALAGDECCVVENPGQGALALKGTQTIVARQGDRGYYDLDITLRLERSSNIHFFRIFIPGIDLVAEPLRNEGYVCLTIWPGETFGWVDPTVTARIEGLVTDILDAFFPGAGLNNDNTRLVITRNSITDAMGGSDCDDPNYLSDPTLFDQELCRIPGATPPAYSSMGNVTIYAINASKPIKYEEGTCPGSAYPPTP